MRCSWSSSSRLMILVAGVFLLAQSSVFGQSGQATPAPPPPAQDQRVVTGPTRQLTVESGATCSEAPLDRPKPGVDGDEPPAR